MNSREFLKSRKVIAAGATLLALLLIAVVPELAPIEAALVTVLIELFSMLVGGI